MPWSRRPGSAACDRWRFDPRGWALASGQRTRSRGLGPPGSVLAARLNPSHLIRWSQAGSTSDSLRQAALEGLVSLGGPGSQDTVATLCRDEQASAGARRLALMALTALDLESATKSAVLVLNLAPDGTGAAEVFDAFLQRKNGGAMLARALVDQKLPGDVARVGMRVVRSSGRDAPALVQALTKAGSLTFGPRKLAAREMAQMVAEVGRQGDPVRGERIYRRKDMLCQKCHAIAGAGGQVGPDLTSIGASAQVDYLVESLLEPNKAVKENYHCTSDHHHEGTAAIGDQGA